MVHDPSQLIADLPVAVCVCEADGAIRSYNCRAAELWGREPRLGDTDETFCGGLRLFRLDGSPLAHAETPMAAVLRDGRPRSGEIVIERPDGSRVTVSASISPLHDAEGRFAGAVNTFQDVTARRAAEEALRLSEARYRAIVEDQPEMMCRFLADGTMTFANQAYRDYFGLRLEELGEWRYTPVVHPDDVPRVEQLLASLTPDNSVVTIRNRVMRGDGAMRWTEWTNHAIYDGHGRVRELQATGRDITEQLRAEEDAARLAAIVASAEDAIVGESLDGVITSWNRAAEAMYGHTAAEAVGRSITLILPPERQDEELEILGRLTRGETVEHFETERLAKDGRRLPVSLTVSLIRDGNGRVIGASKIARDITERRRAEEAIEDLLERERAAHREADEARAAAERASGAKDEFLAMLAHELRNPLGVIVNAVALIDERADLPPQPRRATAMIRRQVEHLTRLIDDLLDVARITSGRIEMRQDPVDLRVAVGMALEAQRHHIERRGQRLSVELPPEPLVVAGDSVRLQQVAGNLVDNASKYTPAGGSIWVTLAPEGGEAVLRVRDDGTGIPADKIDSIFELFAQANPTLARTEGGLGIGLTLVKQVVELHRGGVVARSEGAGRGAEFTVRLPLAREARTAAAPSREAVRPEPRRILVIEDHADAREMLALTLEAYGHEVRQAGSGREGLDLAAAYRPEVVLVDIGLPDIEGYAVGRELRQRFGSGVHLIALTGYGQPQDRARSREAGFDAHLVKPVEPPKLAEALHQLTTSPGA